MENNKMYLTFCNDIILSEPKYCVRRMCRLILCLNLNRDLQDGIYLSSDTVYSLFGEYWEEIDVLIDD